jgi:hypothetical protein
MIIKMPRWQSYMATTTEPMFNPEQCQDIINAGHAEKPQIAEVGMAKNKPGGGVDKKKEQQLYLGYLLKNYHRCIKK